MADNSTEVVCSFDLGETRPGGAFAFRAWWNQGVCIRSVAEYAQCQARLESVLANNIDALHGAEYSAAATVLTLLPTIGALFGGSPSETWALLKICPPVGVLALSLSFGGSMMPVNLQDYISTWSKQGVHASLMDTIVVAEKDQQTSGQTTSSDPVHEKIRLALNQAAQTRRKSPNCIVALWLAIIGLFGLFLAVMVGMAIIEQGAVYSTWCTSIWWMHLWYLVVTITAMLDAWIHKPFSERWNLFISEAHSPILSAPRHRDMELDRLLSVNDPSQFKSAVNAIEPSSMAPLHPTSTQTSTGMLVVISVTREDKRLAAWLTGLRLFSKAGNITIYVFGTSVFAAVTVLALPMAQMILILVMGAGVFGRAIVSGIVRVVAEHRPILHILADSNAHADEMLKCSLRYKAVGSDRPLVFDVNGAIFMDDQCIGRRNKWSRILLGLFAAPFRSAASGNA